MGGVYLGLDLPTWSNLDPYQGLHSLNMPYESNCIPMIQRPGPMARNVVLWNYILVELILSCGKWLTKARAITLNTPSTLPGLSLGKKFAWPIVQSSWMLKARQNRSSSTWVSLANEIGQYMKMSRFPFGFTVFANASRIDWVFLTSTI